MKSVLVSLDFVYNKEGNLVPLELNTNTSENIGELKAFNTVDYWEEASRYFNHEELHAYLQEHSISKIITISSRRDRFIDAFCVLYNYENDFVFVPQGQVVIPNVEDSDDTLIIRVSYDSYALIDDLYARDNFEFHSLISSESFASPVTFTQDGFDTINSFEASQDGIAPNYVVKPRTPNYSKTEYPKIYKLETEEQLNSLKAGLEYNEFIQKYEFHPSESFKYDRVIALRSMNLIIGSNLDVINILNYKTFNSISTTNEKLVIDYDVNENFEMHPLQAAKYYPTWESRVGTSYHFDDNDQVLLADNTLARWKDLSPNKELIKTINLSYQETPEAASGVRVLTPENLQDFQISSSEIDKLWSIQKGLFVDITANHDELGEFQWYDGGLNAYLTLGEGGSINYKHGGRLEEGDVIHVYNNSTEQVLTLNITNIQYSIKDIPLYKMSLESRQPEFLIKLSDDNDDLFLIQHNLCNRACTPENIYPRVPAPQPWELPSYPTCSSPIYSQYCGDCGKNGEGCVQCGGADADLCED